MTKQEINAIQASLFSPTFIENESFVINQQDIAHIDAYHNCLMDCPEPHTFLNNGFGISDKLITQCNIGFVDPIVFETEISSTCLKGCFTLPLLNSHCDSGVYGMRYHCHNLVCEVKAHVSYGDMPVYAPFAMGETALLIDNPFTALALSEMGYKNAVSALGNGISAMALSALAQLGISNLVVFTHALSDSSELIEASVLAKRHGIKLCPVTLPFKVDMVGNWDGYQWQLFDKRLSAALKSCNTYNERYQA